MFSKWTSTHKNSRSVISKTAVQKSTQLLKRHMQGCGFLAICHMRQDSVKLAILSGTFILQRAQCSSSNKQKKIEPGEVYAAQFE